MTTAPGEYEPPFIIRRPFGREDFERMEAHQKRWSYGTRVYRPMLMAEIAQPHAGLPPPAVAPWEMTYGPSGRLNPAAKNWCFFLVEDRYRNIIGIYCGFGITESAYGRLLRPDSEDLPLDDLTWDERYVPNPAHPEYTHYGVTTILTDWTQPEFVKPFLPIAYHHSDLLPIDVLFSQLAEVEPTESPIPERFGFRFIRRNRARLESGEEGSKVSVWVWERDAETSLAKIPRQFRSELEATPAQVANLAKFYQSLSRPIREELIAVLQNYSVKARIELHGEKKRKIDGRRQRLRESLEKIENERPDGLTALGIDLARGDLRELPSLFLQFKVTQALQRIAWFYSEFPENL